MNLWRPRVPLLRHAAIRAALRGGWVGAAIEADHAQLKRRLRPMGGLRTDQTAQVVIAGHAFMQNLRRGHYHLALDTPPATRLAAALTDLARAL
jgi:transposase-like protein